MKKIILLASLLLIHIAGHSQATIFPSNTAITTLQFNGITDAQTITSTTPVDVIGGSFTLSSAGTWVVIVKITGMHNPSASVASFGIYNSSDVLQNNTVSNLYTTGVGGTLGLFSSEQVVLITTNGSETFKLKAVVSTGSTLTIKNSSSQSNTGNGGNSKIIAFK